MCERMLLEELRCDSKGISRLTLCLSVTALDQTERAVTDGRNIRHKLARHLV